MNRIDDITIERYLDGSMSASEKAEFRALMANDPGLSRRVSAEESMMRTLRADRDAVPRDHALVRSRVLASIPQIAPANGVAQQSPSSSRTRRWPIIGTALFLAAWIVADIVSVEAGDESRVSGSPTATTAPAATNAAEPATTTPSPSVDAAPIAPPTTDEPMAARQNRSDVVATDVTRSTASSEVIHSTPRRAASRAAASTDARSSGNAGASAADVSDIEKSADAGTDAHVALKKRTDSVARTRVKINQ